MKPAWIIPFVCLTGFGAYAKGQAVEPLDTSVLCLGADFDRLFRSEPPCSCRLPSYFDTVGFNSFIVRGQDDAAPDASSSTATQATDPTAILTQFQLQNVFIPSTYDASGYSNQFILQPVIPIATKLGPFVNHIIRPTLPVVTTADPDGAVTATTGLGDLTFLDVYLPERQAWGTWGVGPVAIIPTATDERTGRGKFQLGPAAVVFYTAVPKWQFGVFVQAPFTIGGSSSRPDVNTVFVQPIATRRFENGWYAGWGDLQWAFETSSGNYNIPIHGRIGKVGKLWGRPVNVFVEPFYTPDGFRNGPAAEWGIKLNVTLLFPEAKFYGPLSR